MKPSISIIIPALNEEKNISPTIKTILNTTDDRFSEFEIIIFDDASSDATGKIADQLAQVHPQIRVIHNPTTCGYGYNFKHGVEAARNEYLVMFPGDNDMEEGSINRMFDLIGQADCVLGFTTNIPCDRPLTRRVMSRLFTLLINRAFGLRLRYYNGPVIHRSQIIKNIPITTYGFGFQSESLVKIFRQGYSFTEVGISLRGRKFGSTKAFKIKNVISVVETMLRLFWTVNISQRQRYNQHGRKIETGQ